MFHENRDTENWIIRNKFICIYIRNFFFDKYCRSLIDFHKKWILSIQCVWIGVTYTFLGWIRKYLFHKVALSQPNNKIKCITWIALWGIEWHVQNCKRETICVRGGWDMESWANYYTFVQFCQVFILIF